jgi:DNA-binding GntR family transcriptional regulator
MSNASKKDLAYGKIKNMILRGRKTKEDVDLSENVLAKKFDMSRTPIREALQKLQLEGFIKILPKKGIVVQDVSMEEIREIYDIRIALEEFVVREIASMVMDRDVQKLREIVKEQQSCLAPVDPGLFLKTDREFHEYIFRLYGNSMIQEFMSNLRERIYMVNFSMLQSAENMRLFYEEHIRIIDALKEHNGEKAVMEMDVHLKGGKMRLMNL